MVLDGGTWDEEIDRWADVPARFTQAAYSQLNVREKTGKNASATRPTNRLKDEYREPYDTLILDEAQYIKGRDSKWTLAVKAIESGQTFLASGTPIPNWADELFIPLQILFPEEARPGGRFGSYWRWAKEWFDTTPNRFSKGAPVVGDLLGCNIRCFDRPVTDPCEHYLAFHEANLGDRFLQRRRDEVLTDLPPLTTQQVLTPMRPNQAKVYRELKRDFVSWAAGNGEEIVAYNAAALNEILTKVSVGLEVVDPAASGSGKFDQLSWDLANRARPTLVVAHHQDVLEVAKRVVVDPLGAKAAVVHGGTPRGLRARHVADFKAGRLDVLLGSLETISEGLTLVAADMCIMLQKSYKPSRNQQAIRRIHRIGQTRPVTIREYLTPNTVDYNKEELLATKTDRQMRHLRAAELAKLL